ncbi:MAG TPA: lysyl oxidase family protein [Candidatus Thermoplasmatota archaeon]|jgi:hypothetical protein|nr:lysyl oxidase family protein [Candidatus Thermoplasmatota archaeon]
MRPLAVILVLASLALLAVPSAVLSPTTDAATPVPCRDPRGCPDMSIDLPQLYVGHQDQVNIPANSCLITEGYVPGPGLHTLLRFDIGAPNLGAGDLVLGAPWDNPDLFFFSSCHNHWHLRDYVTTRVWTVTGWASWELLRQQNPDWTAAQTFAAHPELLAETTFAAKISFCAVDVYPMPANQGGATVPDLQKYTECDDQGVSKGWSDLYIWSQTGNWADITGLAPGLYMLEAEVNTNRIFQESSYANNRGAVPVVVYPCELDVCDLPV